MARDAVTIVAPALNDKAASGAGTTIAPANGAVIAAEGVTDGLLVRVINTFAGAKKVTFKAGGNPPALVSGLGDLEISLAQNDDILVKLESARFCQANGDVWVDFEAAMTGTIRASRA